MPSPKKGRGGGEKNSDLGWFSRHVLSDKGSEGSKKLENWVDIIYGWFQKAMEITNEAMVRTFISNF